MKPIKTIKKDSMAEVFVCEHHFCHNQKGEQKPRFSSRSNKTQHERGLGLHPCTVANCGCCRELERAKDMNRKGSSSAFSLSSQMLVNGFHTCILSHACSLSLS
ncbi:hypothetical protein QOT17_25654 [Balamuthia mandrillaris]